MGSTGGAVLPAGLGEAEVREQVDRILASDLFSQSARQSRFLRYIVDKSLDGRTDRLKGYCIGVDVFDRDERFDPGADAIVRVEAGRLRTKLRDYYHRLGSGDPVRIEVAKGTYAPTFLRNTPESDSVAAGDQHRSAIAVLPFRSLSTDPDQVYFSDGVTDTIITALAQDSGLRVISLTSVLRFRDTERPIAEVAEELSASHLLEGTIYREDNRIRITAQLIEASTDSHLWAKSYERELSSVLDLQREVAGDIAMELAGRVSARGFRNTRSGIASDAYDQYLLGRRHRGSLTEEGFHKAAHCFEKAIEIQPDYASAYAALASCYCALGSYGFEFECPHDIIPRGLEYSRKAMEMDPGVVDAHTFTAIMTLKYEWNWPRAEQLFRKALSVSPSDTRTHVQFSLYYESLGEHDAAVREALEARRLDPLSMEVNLNLVWQLHQARRDEDALARLNWSEELNPDFWGIHWCHGHVALRRGEFEAATHAFERAAAAGGGHTIPLQGLGYACAVGGQPDRARGVIADLEEMAHTSYVSPVHMAAIHAGLSQWDSCFELLERGFEMRARSLAWLRVAKEFEAAHADPRFQRLVERIGIPQPRKAA